MEMDRETYLALRAEQEGIIAQARRKIDALDTVWGMLGNRDVTVRKRKPRRKIKETPSSTPAEAKDSAATSAFSPTEATKAVVLTLPFDLDIRQPLVLEKILAEFPEVEKSHPKPRLAAQIAGALRRQASQGLLVEIKPASGRSSAVYRRKPKEGENN
jgi:hypothetical protein